MILDCHYHTRSSSRGATADDDEALPAARRQQRQQQQQARRPRGFFRVSFPERNGDGDQVQRRAATATATATPEEEKVPEPYSPSLALTPTSNRVGGHAAATIADTDTDINAAFAQIRANLIGRLDSVGTPFGFRPLVCEF